jgi:methylthioribose-1-phosphate isomerase
MFPRTIEWSNDRIVLLDQRRLPADEIYLQCTRVSQVAEAIRTLAVRGAPAIGIAAAMGIALAAVDALQRQAGSIDHMLREACRILANTRPTAVNLQWSLSRMKGVYETHQHEPGDRIAALLVREANIILEEDVATNRRIGEAGKELVKHGATILTHCNTGALATGGYGTALGVIRRAWEVGRSPKVIAGETRPLFQGARLTAWELQRDGIPVTLIADSMAGYVMQQGDVDLVLVGADRIARNGDVANKIGTYTLAVLAKEHGVPFYVAAPLSTIDMSLETGADIPIEERDEAEVVELPGGFRITPPGIPARNPAFDITPHAYISGIITEHGVIGPPLEQGLRNLRRSVREQAANHHASD